MKRLRLLLLATTAVAAALLATAAFARETAGLKGEVYPTFKIEVTNNGRDLRTLHAGTYTMKVEDKSAIHDFHLVGPGIDRRTGVTFKGEVSWRVTFKPGKYTVVCDPHATTMHTSFRVTR